jgi:hypothetical protein
MPVQRRDRTADPRGAHKPWKSNVSARLTFRLGFRNSARRLT